MASVLDLFFFGASFSSVPGSTGAGILDDDAVGVTGAGSTAWSVRARFFFGCSELVLASVTGACWAVVEPHKCNLIVSRTFPECNGKSSGGSLWSCTCMYQCYCILTILPIMCSVGLC